MLLPRYQIFGSRLKSSPIVELSRTKRSGWNPELSCKARFTSAGNGSYLSNSADIATQQDGLDIAL